MGVCLVSMALGACAGPGDAGERTPASAILSHPTPANARPSPQKSQAAAAVVMSPPQRSIAPPALPVVDPKVITRAQELVAAAAKLYHSGAYDQAERSLKEAITLYPFLADANLLLGKIFLLKGSATRDVSLVQSARLMFEMAHAIDPTLREAEVLLGLFALEPAE